MVKQTVGALAGVLALAVVALAGCGGGAATCGWLGSVKGMGAQNQQVVMTVPPTFTGADLLVAATADDGPDTVPGGGFTSPTTALLGGTSGLKWTRLARVSARHDVALPGDRLDQYGASSTELWEAIPPAGWRGTGKTITEISSHPRASDDGHAVVVSAYANGTVNQTAVADGLGGRGAERLTRNVPAGSAVYLSALEGRVKAHFLPTARSHNSIQRRAGDDTMGVVASNSRALPAGPFTIGQRGDPGAYWEEAMVVVSPTRSP
ncbi:MAG: hypothetical protein M3137_07145 [Actinomycetota bacterium]|nr:hypothetical protein [Actinomycetota bacterium]